MHAWSKSLVVVGTLLLFLISGCSTVGDAVVDGIVSGASRAAEERVANAVYQQLAPLEKLPPPATVGWNQFMVMQAQIVFAYTFSPGGLWLGQTEYQPGEWTQFEVQPAADEADTIHLERALLKRDPNGHEWWRLSWSQGEETWVYEALLDPAEEQLLRLRARDAKGNEEEIPVTEETAYYPSTKLTPESIEGATVGEEEITTSVGSFTAQHVEYKSTSTKGKTKWWLSDQIPGGVIKYQMIEQDENVVWTSTLAEMGDDATTQLGSY